MTPAWWIHLASSILQYPYQKHRPHTSSFSESTQKPTSKEGDWKLLFSTFMVLYGTGRQDTPSWCSGYAWAAGEKQVLPHPVQLSTGRPVFRYREEARSGAGYDSPPGILGHQRDQSCCLWPLRTKLPHDPPCF